MRMPTSVDQLPSFNKVEFQPAQPQNNPWLPLIAIVGIVIIVIGITLLVNDGVNEYAKLKSREIED